MALSQDNVVPPLSEQALAAARLLEASGAQFVALMNPEGLFYYASQSHVGYYGYAIDEIVGHYLDEFLTPADYTTAELVLGDGELTDQSIEIGLHIIAKNGRLVPIRGSVRLLDIDGEHLLLTRARALEDEVDG